MRELFNNWYDLLKDENYIQRSWLDILKEQEDHQEISNVRIGEYNFNGIDVLYPVYDVSDHETVVDFNAVLFDEISTNETSTNETSQIVDDDYLYRIGVMDVDNN